MNHDDIVKSVSDRIDKLEEHIDAKLEVVISNKKDLDWIKGSAKIAITVSVSLFTIIIATLINISKGV